MTKNQYFDNLVKTHWTDLVRRLCYRGLDRLRSEEFVQEAFIRLHAKLSSGESIDSPRAWLIKVSENLFKDFLKSGETTYEEITTNGDLPEETLSEDEISNSVLIQDCVQEKIELFAKNFPDRAIAIQHQLDEKSIDYIAKLLERTEHATRQFIYESKKKLEVFLAPCKELISC